MKRLLDALDAFPTTLKAGLCFLLLACVAAIDYATGVDISVAGLYPIPVVLTAWWAGRWQALFMAVMAASTQFAIRVLLEPGQRIPAVYFWNASMDLAVYAGPALAIVALRKAYARESLLARRDALTGVANRRAFFERAELEFQRARRYGGAPFSLAYLDLDDFKAVNDRFGHEAGDAVLKTVAATIQDRIRSTDLLARLGGDEFAVLLVGAEEAQTEAVLDDLRRQLHEALSHVPGGVSVSLGAVSLRSDFGSFDDVMTEVDRLMYAEKERARNARLRALPPTVPLGSPRARAR